MNEPLTWYQLVGVCGIIVGNLLFVRFFLWACLSSPPKGKGELPESGSEARRDEGGAEG